MEKDPDYLARLENLPESERRGLLHGEWDFFEGQYFDEFKREIHTCTPFEIPPEWRRYVAFDYGLDMLAAYWIAVDNLHNCYVYRELCQSNLPISTAAQKILEYTPSNEKIYAFLAPPDLWGRSQETGKSKAILFGEAGLDLTKSNNDRESGWLAVKELLKQDANGNPRLHIFTNCKWLIKYLPELQRDEKKPTDCATEPHEITHSPDALRYFAIYWINPAPAAAEKRVHYRRDELEDYRNAKSQAERDIIIKRKGGKPL
jgi:phage terminase large subunit